MKVQSHVAITLGIGLAFAIFPGIFQQGAFATAYGGDSSQDMTANPSGANVTNGNMTGAEEGIPTANITGTDPVVINDQITD